LISSFFLDNGFLGGVFFWKGLVR